MAQRVEILKHQIEFMVATERFVCQVGGLGCGKSFGVAGKAFALSKINAGFDGMVVSRTSNQLNKLLIEIHKFFSLMGMNFVSGIEKLKFMEKTPAFSWMLFDRKEILINWGNGLLTTIYLGTTEGRAYTRWAGGNLAWVVIDEIDTMQYPEEVWRFANDRIRVKAPLLQLACASTPEGYGFLWGFFVDAVHRNPELAKDRRLIKGVTFDNPNLDVSYVKAQLQTRDPASLRAYVFGEFVNLDGTLVYYRFNKNNNVTDKVLADFPLTSVCHIGVDFNKGINAANITIIQNGIDFTVKEFNGAVDVDHLIADIRRELNGRPIAIYPDASGYEGIRQLERAFGEQAVHYPSANPHIFRRVASVNKRLTTDTGVATHLINPKTCPTLFKGLLAQSKDDKGMPDKTKGHDHQLDGFGYKLYNLYPVDDDVGVVRVPDFNDPEFRQLRAMISQMAR